MLEDKNLEEYDKLTEQELERLIAKKYGFKNVREFRAATNVTESGCQEVIRAMDERLITIYQAEKLLDFPIEIQLELLSKGEKAIREYLREDRKKRNTRTIKFAIAVFGNPILIKAEKTTKLPLREAFSELLMRTGESREFEWDAKKLKKKCFPNKKADFSKILDALSKCGMIQRSESTGKFLWDPIIDIMNSIK